MENTDSRQVTFALLGAVVVLTLVFAFSSAWYSDWYAVFRVTHVLVAFLWVGGGLMITVLAILAERRNDTAELLVIARQAAFVGERIFAPAGLIVLAMGIAMMINTNWGWGKFWVIFGLLGYAATFVTGIAVLAPLTKKIVASVEANGPEHPETVALIKRILLLARVDVAVLLLVVADMVTKPFS
jgi:uncharacterized membrane protein